MVAFPSMLPADKRLQEVFWVRALTTKLEEYAGHTININSNEDDSAGNHDVILEIDDQVFGIQVTELTYELMKKRANIRQHYIEKLLAVLQERQVVSQTKVAISIMFSSAESQKLDLIQPDQMIETVLRNIQDVTERKILPFEYGNIWIEPVIEGKLCIPRYGNIGIDVNFDQLPRSLDTYTSAVKYLAKKKINSKSPWLLIWSLEFWHDKHWLGNEVIEYMKKTFRNTGFERVYFLETLDGDGMFQANLVLNRIKE